MTDQPPKSSPQGRTSSRSVASHNAAPHDSAEPSADPSKQATAPKPTTTAKQLSPREAKREAKRAERQADRDEARERAERGAERRAERLAEIFAERGEARDWKEHAPPSPKPKPKPRRKPVPSKPAARKSQQKTPRKSPSKPTQKRPSKPRKKSNAPLPVVEVAGTPQPRGFETGHWVAIISFVAMVILPSVVAAWYLWARVADQYAAHVGLTVQQDAGINPAQVMGGLAVRIGGQGQMSDTDILNEYLRSPALVATLTEQIDLKAHYSAPHDSDPIFALHPNATLSDLIDYWWRILYIRYDTSAGLIDLRVQAFDPDTAQRIADLILEEARRVINELAVQARADTVRFAEEDVERAQMQVRRAREALIAFQSRSQILDPQTDVAGRLGVVTTLQSELAEALIALDALGETAQAGDPRLATTERRVAVIRQRIDAERSNMAVGATGESYPELLAEFQRLDAERRHAAETLAEAFLALDGARSEAARQNRYVIAYVAPTLADTATYPNRLFWCAMVVAAGFLSWFLLNVGYVSIRDRR